MMIRSNCTLLLGNWGERMRIGILGPGAIGGLLAARLRDENLTLFARGATLQALGSGLVLHSPDGEVIQISPSEYTLVNSEEELTSQIDIAFICGKSASTPKMSELAQQVLAEDGIAISIQNGLGHSEVLASRLGWSRVLSASTVHGATRLGLNEVRWTGVGSISIGSLNQQSPRLADSRISRLFSILEKADLSPIWVDDMQKTLWMKLLLNIAINPLAAISGVENGTILEQPGLMNQAMAVMEEARTVAMVEGIEIGQLEIVETLTEVLQRTAGNRCSMLQDVIAAKKTEIDSFCGEVVSRAEHHGIPTPLNNQLIALIKAIEESYGIR